MNLQQATVSRIRELCRQNNLSEYKMIELSDIPSSTIKCILSGKTRNPGIENIKKIAAVFGLGIREFFDSDLFDDLDE